jgi:hypothetical protein
MLRVRRDAQGLAGSKNPFALIGRPGADLAADNGDRFRDCGVDMARHTRRIGAHVQVGNKFAAGRFGCPDSHYEAFVGMLVDLSGPHHHGLYPLSSPRRRGRTDRTNSAMPSPVTDTSDVAARIRCQEV